MPLIALTAVSLRMPRRQSPCPVAQHVSDSARDKVAARSLFAYFDPQVRLLAGAEETFGARPTLVLVGEHFPAVGLRCPLSGHTSLPNSSAARRRLGWTRRWSWRAYAAARP